MEIEREGEAAPLPAPGTMTPLDPRHVWIVRLSFLVPLLILAGLVAGADLFFLSDLVDGWPRGWAAGAGAVLALLAFTLLPGRHHRAWRYAALDDELHIQRGLLVRRRILVPYGRVQHIDVGQGPAERALGLATLGLHTAGTIGARIALPGLAAEDAAALRERIRAEIRQDLL